MLMNHNKMEAL